MVLLLTSEYLIKQALTKLGKNKTMIIIAHRLTTIENADLIIVLDKGKLIEQGSHDELLNKQGVYRSLYLQQED